MVTKKTTKKKTKLIEDAINENKSTKVVFPKVTVGSHLTVTEFANGTTFLAWNDEELLKEIQAVTK